MPSWEYLKGAKKEKRINKASGFEYFYTEGSMSFPDPLDRPARTIPDLAKEAREPPASSML